MSAALLQFSPRVGRWWCGGMFAGEVDGIQIILGGFAPTPLDWAEATAWAAAFTAGRCNDWTLPTLRELYAVHSLFPRMFKPEVYWTCESQTDHAHAFHYRFDAHTPVTWGKIYRGYAIAVRRIHHIT